MEMIREYADWFYLDWCRSFYPDATWSYQVLKLRLLVTVTE